MAFIGFSKNTFIEYNQLTEKYSWPTISLHVKQCIVMHQRRMTESVKRSIAVLHAHERNEPSVQ